jgi:hypothetical protein
MGRLDLGKDNLGTMCAFSVMCWINGVRYPHDEIDIFDARNCYKELGDWALRLFKTCLFSIGSAYSQHKCYGSLET